MDSVRRDPPSVKARPPRSPLLPGFVYLAEAAGAHKIGLALSLKRRMDELTRHSPVAVRFVHAIPCDQPLRLERALHARYAGRRLHGEWFWLKDAEVEEIRAWDEDPLNRHIDTEGRNIVAGRPVALPTGVRLTQQRPPEDPCPRCAGSGSVPALLSPGDAVLYVVTTGPDGTVDTDLAVNDLVTRALQQQAPADEDFAVWALYPASDGRGPRLVAVLRPTVSGLSPHWL